MTQSEKSILNETLVAVSSLPGTCVWQNNTGQAWLGRRVQFYPGTEIPVPPGTVVLTGARPVNYGLVGSGDAIGAFQGRPLAIETKALLGRQRPEQRNFEVAWKKAGGIYILGRSADEIVETLLM